MRSKSISDTLFLCVAVSLLISISQWAQAAATCTATTPNMMINYVSPNYTAVTGTLTLSCTSGPGPTGITMTYSINALPPAASPSDLQYVLTQTIPNTNCAATLWDGGTPLTGTFIINRNSTVNVPITFYGCAAAGQYPYLSSIPYIVSITGTIIASAGPVPTFSSPGFTLTTFLNPLGSSACAFTAAPGPITFNYSAFSNTAINANTSFGLVCSPGLSPTMSLDATVDVVTGLNYTLGLNTVPGPSGISPLTVAGMGYSVTYYINGSMAAGQAGTCTGINCTNSNGHMLTISY